MKVMGLDVSTNSTGWSVIESDQNNLKIIDCGLIRSVGSMGTTQRLYFLGNELKKILEKFCPDEIGIEETLFMRGPKILRTLSRFSGVAIYQAYAYQKKEVILYEPPAWRKIIGVSGSCSKAEVQIEICRRFNLLTQKQIDGYRATFEKIVSDVASLKVIGKQQKILKKDLNKQIQEIEKGYDKASVDIYSDSGINNDMADSISIALAVISEKEGKV